MAIGCLKSVPHITSIIARVLAKQNACNLESVRRLSMVSLKCFVSFCAELGCVHVNSKDSAKLSRSRLSHES